MLVLFPVAAGDLDRSKQACDEGELDGACALAAKCALELTKSSTGGVHKVEEDGVSAVLRMHCAIGCAYLGVPSYGDAFTPSMRLVSIRRGRGWFLFRI